MAVTEVLGSDAADILAGTTGDDLIYGFDPAGTTATASSITAVRVASGLDQPVFATAAPGDTDHLFLVERTGAIEVLDLRDGAISTFLEISSTITTAGEGGLIGLAFDPDYAANGHFYVNVTNLQGDTEIRRYQVSSGNALQADSASALTIISVDQPAGLTNHKAGWLGFGRDGLLYIPLGDGGGGGDPGEHAQNPQSLLGKILRLDVRADEFPTDPTRNYGIPPDNPFLNETGVLPEIWALGLRNPFRSGFDRDLGTLFIGDVGQGAFEEIDIGAAGANYGWDVFEGEQSFEPGPLGPGALTDPIHTYGRSIGATVIGGYVYRGESDALQGAYFFADFITNRIFTLRRENGAWFSTDRTTQLALASGSIDSPVSFGEDAHGNLYLVDFDGDVFRLTPNATSLDIGDTVAGGMGNDTVHAGAGDDMVFGGAGDDVIFAGEGFDRLLGGPGADVLLGGAGLDLADYSTAGAAIIADLRAPTNNTGEAAGDRYSSIEGLIGSEFDDVLVGAHGGSTISGRGGNDTVSGGDGTDVVDLGDGRDVYRGELGDLQGDRLAGFSSGDALEITGARIGRDNLVVVANPGMVTMSVGTFSFQLDGDFSGGDFMSVARGSGPSMRTTVSFESHLPTLQEGLRVGTTSINGVANEPFLTGDGTVGFALEMVSAISAYRNALGVYSVAADGTIGNVRIVFSNTLAVAAGTMVDLGSPGVDERIGFFLVQDGFRHYGTLPDDLAFVTPGTMSQADLDSGEPPVLWSATRGDLTSAPVFHSFSTLNPGDAEQILSGVATGGRALLLGFEDLPSTSGDNDFQDIVFGMRINADNDFFF